MTKVTDLATAVASIPPGSHVALSGFATSRSPMAFSHEMIRQGKSITDARNGGSSGCVETGAFGKESYILTGYFNLVKVLEITLHNGIDPKSGKMIGIESGNTILIMILTSPAPSIRADSNNSLGIFSKNVLKR